MLDILENAKSKLQPKAVAEVEAAIEYALGGVAEDYFAHSSTKDWREAYNYAASFLAPSKEGNTVIRRMKKEFPPILSVHAKADITEVGRKHFLALLKLKDPQAVIQGLANLGRWRGGEDEELGSWARSMITSLVNDYNKNLGLGPGGKCVCKNCGSELSHVSAVPCTDVSCPDCGKPMARSISQAELYVPTDPPSVSHTTENEDEDVDEEEEKVVDIGLDRGESSKPLEAEDKPDTASEGFCKCPECGYAVPFTPESAPCESMECPKCPGVMLEFVNSLEAQTTTKSLKALRRIKKKN